MTEVKTNSFLDKQTQQKMPKRIAVAWSGGADSTALLLMLQSQNFDVAAWHIDHGWAENSSELALDLGRKAESWNIPFLTKRLCKPTFNIEAESRRLRYEAFAALAVETNCYHLALGHHADDQAETIYMRLLQGSGVAGCQGMQTYRKQGDLHLWRPMLESTRYDMEKYLKNKKVAWLEDPSNMDCELWRNKIRHKLFPAMVENGANPQQLFLRFGQQARIVQHDIEKLAEHIVIHYNDNADESTCSMSWDEWSEQVKAVRVFLLQKMIGILFADGKVFGRRHFEAIEQWKNNGGNGWVNLSGCHLEKQGKNLKLFRGFKGLENIRNRKV